MSVPNSERCHTASLFSCLTSRLEAETDICPSSTLIARGLVAHLTLTVYFVFIPLSQSPGHNQTLTLFFLRLIRRYTPTIIIPSTSRNYTQDV